MKKRADELKPGDVVQAGLLTGTVISAIPHSFEISTRSGTFYRHPHELVEVNEPTITVTLKRSEAQAWSDIYGEIFDASFLTRPILSTVRDALKCDC